MRRLRPNRDGIGPFQSFPDSSQNTFVLDVVSKKFAWMNAEAVLGVICGETAHVHDESRIQSVGRLCYEYVGTAISSLKSRVVSSRGHGGRPPNGLQWTAAVATSDRARA
jgi:hypothetical protein